jgi:hypothetical protein
MVSPISKIIQMKAENSLWNLNGAYAIYSSPHPLLGITVNHVALLRRYKVYRKAYVPTRK